MGVEGVGVNRCSGSWSIACPTQAISQAVRTGSPRSGAMRLDMCSTSGQLVRIASSSAGSATSAISARRTSATAPSGRAAPLGAPSRARLARACRSVSGGVCGGLGRPVLIVCCGRERADRRSIREPPATLRRIGRPLVTSSLRFASHWGDEGPGCRSGRRGRGLCRDRAASGGSSRCAGRRCARARAGGRRSGWASPTASRPSVWTPPAARSWSS